MTGREQRLLDGPGFAVFTRRSAYAAETIVAYLELDRAIRHVVYVPHKTSDPALGQALAHLASARGIETEIIPFEEYGDPARIRAVGEKPAHALAIVVADLRRMVSDRLDLRLQYLYTRHRARKKIIVDAVPYEAAPWRVFFPFGVFNRHLLAYNHSYAIEGDYEKFLDGNSAHNPCDPAAVASKTWRAAFVDGDRFFDPRPDVVTLPATPADQAAYAVHREALFASEKSITSLKSKLAKWIQERYPSRAVPVDLKRVYAPDFRRVVATDLPFDRWLVDEIHRLMDHTDALLGLYARYQREHDGC